MKFNGKITKHGTGHKVLVPINVMTGERLHPNDEVVVDIVKAPKRPETFCSKCIRRGDCWIKATMECKRGFTMIDLNEREQNIVIRASNHDCDLYDEEERKVTYCVANNNGDLVAHDIRSKAKADAICEEKQKEEPDAEWEVLEQEME